MEGLNDFYNVGYRYLRPPYFRANIDCVRLFMGRFEMYKDSFGERWSNQFTMNFLASCVCDHTLLVLTNFPRIIRESFDLAKHSLISHFDSGENDSELFDKLNNCRQEKSQNVIDYYHSLLVLNKALQVPPEIFRLIFFAGLRVEIKDYLAKQGNDNMPLSRLFFLAKKFEVVNKNFNKIPRYKVSGEYPNRYKDNNYTNNNLDQGIYNENEIGNYYPFTGDNDGIYENEMFQSRKGYLGHHYTQPRCMAIKTSLDNNSYLDSNKRDGKIGYTNEYSSFASYRNKRVRQNRSLNFGRIKKQNATSNCSDKYNSFVSLERRRYRMRSSDSNEDRFLDMDRKVSEFKDHSLQQISKDRHGPYIAVVTTNQNENKNKNKVSVLSENNYISTGGFLTENVVLSPNKITKVFINGKIEQGSKINIQGNLSIQNKLLILLEKIDVIATENGYQCEISNLNNFDVTLSRGTNIANVQYLQTSNLKSDDCNSVKNYTDDFISASENKNKTHKNDFSDKTRAYYGGITVVNKRDVKNAETLERNEEILRPVAENPLSRKIVPDTKCIEKGMDDKSVISPQIIKSQDARVSNNQVVQSQDDRMCLDQINPKFYNNHNLKKDEFKCNPSLVPQSINHNNFSRDSNEQYKLRHREQVLSEIKLYFQSKQSEELINHFACVKQDIAELQLRCTKICVNFDNKLRILEGKISQNNMENSVNRVITTAQVHRNSSIYNISNPGIHNNISKDFTRKNHENEIVNPKMDGALPNNYHEKSQSGTIMFKPPVSKMKTERFEGKLEENSQERSLMGSIIYRPPAIVGSTLNSGKLEEVINDKKKESEEILKVDGFPPVLTKKSTELPFISSFHETCEEIKHNLRKCVLKLHN